MDLVTVAVAFFVGGTAFMFGIYIGSEETWTKAPRADKETVDLVAGLVDVARRQRQRELVSAGDAWLRANRPNRRLRRTPQRRQRA